MRKSIFLAAASLALLAGCVTVNVYFPAAAAQKAADKVIGNILGPDASGQAPAPATSSRPPAAAVVAPASREPVAVRVLNALVPAANAAEAQPNLDVHTAAVEAIEARMRERFRSTLKALLQSGAVGFTNNGDVALRDASKVPLAERAAANQAVAAENADRADLYRQIAAANGHPEWTQSLRGAFAKRWISRAQQAGWYYQDASGSWRK